MKRRELRFAPPGLSEGECAASLYLPAPASAAKCASEGGTTEGGTTEGGLPCVVMAHGVSLTRFDGLPEIAAHFARCGLAALAFDYRHFGDSPGSPRQLLDIARQREDLRAAVALARDTEEIDPERIALWGYSLGASHVLRAAREDPRLAAAVCVAPFVSGLAHARKTPPASLARSLAASAAAMIGHPLDLRPPAVPAVAPAGGHAVIASAEALPGFADLTTDPRSRWRNAVRVRRPWQAPLVAAGRDAARTNAPVLIAIAENDQTAPASLARAAASRARDAETRIYPCGHFDILRRADAATDQSRFLLKHL